MTEKSRKALFPNPFYVILLVASGIFTVTALGYLIGPDIEKRALAQPAAGQPGAGSLALTAWLDRNGPALLAVEIGVMFVSGILAMATDRWFSSRGPTHGSDGRQG